MVRKNFRKTAGIRASLIASFIVMITIPLVVTALLSGDSFDIRNRASQLAIEPSATNPCVISFPYVNPSSVEVGKKVRVQVHARAEEAISNVEIKNGAGEVLFTKVFEQPTNEILEVFTITPSEEGRQSITGTAKGASKDYECKLIQNDVQLAQMTSITQNTAPEFKTTPQTNAQPPSNSIKVTESYKYELIAEDLEKDKIHYTYSFTPEAPWMNITVVEDNVNGRVKLLFQGVANYPASYLANVFIHDNYNGHLRSQSWIINVDQKENDIPQVRVTSPVAGTTLRQGDILDIAWTSTDLNQIIQHKVYIATNPGNANTWTPIDTNLAYNVGRYLHNTSGMTPGTYHAIVQSTDNQNPAATGTGVSGAFAVNAIPVVPPPGNPPPDEDDEPDDGVTLQEAQIINVSPANGSKLKNKRTTISAMLVAGSEATIDKDKISFKVDNKDLTGKLKVNEVSESQYSIIYSPEEDLKEGAHKVDLSFTDSKDNKASKDWTFTIEKEDKNDDETFNFFGFEISKRTATIIAIGLGILLLALIIPWLLYLSWRNSNDEYDKSYTTTASTPPTDPYAPSETYYQDTTYSTEPNQTPYTETVAYTPTLYPAQTEETSNTTVYQPTETQYYTPAPETPPTTYVEEQPVAQDSYQASNQEYDPYGQGLQDLAKEVEDSQKSDFDKYLEGDNGPQVNPQTTNPDQKSDNRS